MARGVAHTHPQIPLRTRFYLNTFTRPIDPCPMRGERLMYKQTRKMGVRAIGRWGAAVSSSGNGEKRSRQSLGAVSQETR